MQIQKTRWFELSGGELRVLLGAAGIVLLALIALQVLRSVTQESEIKLENTRDVFGAPPRLDVNRASEYDLALLPGIGEKTARVIVDYRQSHGKFERLEDLSRVPGIGPKTVERLRPHLMCAPPGKGDK